MGIGRHPGFKPYGKEFGRRLSQALSNQVKEGLKHLTDLKTPAPISFLGRLSRQRGRCLLEYEGKCHQLFGSTSSFWISYNWKVGTKYVAWHGGYI
jgi:hypothetical protein